MITLLEAELNSFCRYAIAGFVSLRILTPDFAMLSSRAMALEAELRAAHSHLKQHAESVAFFGGAAREGTNINRRLQDCLNQQVGIRVLQLNIHT